MLTTKRPTPTTVSYTVSTRSEPSTLAAHLSNTISLLLRLIAGLLVLTALLNEHQTLFHSTIYRLPLPPTLLPALPSALVLATFPPALRISVYALVLWAVFRKGYTSESLLVVRGLGVQTATGGSSFLWGGSTRFIAASAVQDVFIHEAFRGFEVRFYLCIVVEGEEGVVVVFPVSFFHNWFCGLFLVLSVWKTAELTWEYRNRALCLDERSWKRCGGERELVCMSRRIELDFMPRYAMLCWVSISLFYSPSS